METFEDYVEAKMENAENIEKFIEVLNWVEDEFPGLEKKIAWNQPMFTDHGTFIIGFSVAKNHFSVAPEGEVLDIFSSKIKNSGYSHGKKLFQIRWDQDVDYDLLRSIIEFNIEEKKDHTNFWRK